MNRIKTTALTVVAMIVALAAIGFFASIGLALVGAFLTIGAVVALAAWVSSLFASKSSATSATA